MEIDFGNGKHILCRYTDLEGHPDPVFDELTYGEGYHFSRMVRKNIGKGSHYFFHTMNDGVRYITAHYYVSDIVEGYDARHDDTIRNEYTNVHIHPENYPVWWGGTYDPSKEERNEEGDIIIIGDKKKSFGKLQHPVLFDRNLAEKLEFEGNSIQFDVTDKNGRCRKFNECLASATRAPRYITENDARILLETIGLKNNL